MRPVCLSLTILAVALACARGEGQELRFGQQLDRLADDSDKWFTTVIVDRRGGAQEQRMLAWFAADATLAELKAKTHFNVLASSDAYYRENYSPKPPSLPAVIVQRPPPKNSSQGVVVYRAYGGTFPRSAGRLGDEVRSAITREYEGCIGCRRRRSVDVDVDVDVDPNERSVVVRRDDYMPLSPRVDVDINARRSTGPGAATYLGIGAGIGAVAAVGLFLSRTLR